ncbi:PilN domain-containing protein [Modicisalibacter luteus]|uniref:PilN domain-containing protein n=1 Tax=Modicisalibacter luteus TaxID=453962 RepID=UPI003645DDC0
MTIDINLLPWREAQRERRNRRFLIILVLAALVGLAAPGDYRCGTNRPSTRSDSATSMFCHEPSN